MAEKILTPPRPSYDGPHQPGITDPVWPSEPPARVDPNLYGTQYAGQLERQRHLHIVTADVTVQRRTELHTLLESVTRTARHQMTKTPPDRDRRGYDKPVVSRRVTVTVGFGATLFTTKKGDDRFGLAAKQPASLKVMPHSEGDDRTIFRPRDQAADLIILIASDDIYVNEYIFGLFYYGKVHPGISVKQVERGYARPDSREPSGFEDGISNPRCVPPDYHMRHAVYVHEGDQEPGWCVGGTYLGYRKIRRRLAQFFNLPVKGREAVFGVHRDSGDRIPSPHTAHAQKMNPKRLTPDLFGRMDDSRRFLRRPYFFNDGLDANGEEIRGLHHLSFARDLVTQYEWPVMMWAMNRNFPVANTGLDALYEIGGAANVGGGYYFMPRAPQPENEHFGSLLLD